MDKYSEIREYWNKQAETFGESSLATLPDDFVKKLELENIAAYLKDGDYVLDIGCGNGYSAYHFIKQFDIRLHGMDYSEQMIQIAQSIHNRLEPDEQKRISFSLGDVRETGFADETFDVVVTERCLINLTDRADQARAFREIHRILKPGGRYLMCEDTEQALHNLNSIRTRLGLDAIAVRWHNLYLDEEHIIRETGGLFQLLAEKRFSSLYYLASRVINAKIAQENGVEPSYDSEINRVASYFSTDGDFGDYGPVKLYVFKKI